MAFEETFLNNQIWREFSFFASGGVDGVITESASFDNPFKLNGLLIHCSVAFASVEDLTVTLSSAKGSAYNTIFVSQAMNTVQDLFWQLSMPLPFESDDQLIVNLSLVSGVNVIGIKVFGWSVLG